MIEIYLLVLKYTKNFIQEKLKTLIDIIQSNLLALCINIIKAGPIPNHVAFIMDGNRRYAKKKDMAEYNGHSVGYDTLEQVITICRSFEIKEITVYAFSIENFKRTDEEIDAFMNMFTEKIDGMLDKMEKNSNLCIRVIGNLSLIPNPLKARFARLVQLTKHNDALVLNIAFAYTSQDEITNAFQEITNAVHGKKIHKNDIDAFLISRCMYSGRSQTPDMLIRTSGEVRFSDFLLWQCWNTNVIFHQCLWPSFSDWNLLSCICYYQMHYCNQKNVEMQLKNYNNSTRKDEIVMFLNELDKKRFKQLNVYAKEN